MIFRTKADLDNHPCFNKKASASYGRVHLPVAPHCNIQCNFCNRIYDCANENRPGVTAKVQTPSEPPKPHLTEEDYQPRIAERPETAPIYDGMNKAVKVMPWPAACIKAENRCTCYTDQGTKIKDIGKQTCLNYVKDGLPFNPYKMQTAEAAKPTETAYTPDQPQVLTMGGKSPQNLMYDGYEDKALSNEGGKVN